MNPQEKKEKPHDHFNAEGPDHAPEEGLTVEDKKHHSGEEEKHPDKKNHQNHPKDKMIQVKESEHLKLIEEVAAYKDKYMRIFAEFDNARKRMDREKMEFVKYANEELISEFLGILDDLERSVVAAKANHQDYSAFLKGIELVMAHVYELLKKHQVKPIEATGKLFDPHCHEALMQEATDEKPEGTVLEEFQKGYMLGDRVVRTTKVKVAKPKTEG